MSKMTAADCEKHLLSILQDVITSDQKEAIESAIEDLHYLEKTRDENAEIGADAIRKLDMISSHIGVMAQILNGTVIFYDDGDDIKP